MKPIRVIQYGLGSIGCATARTLLTKSGIDLVGAIDTAPDKVGRDLSELLSLPGKMGIRVTGDAAGLFRRSNAQVVVHTTQSFFRDVYDQIESVARTGIDLVSSTEELLYPQLRHPRLAARLDRLAMRNGSTLLGTGVNPGFVMDTLALVLSGVTNKIQHIRITRRVDASTRRMPLQRKIGAGMEPSEFRQMERRGRLGHIGLMESMYLIAEGLGWKLTRAIEKVEPVVAERAQQTEFFTVAAGAVCGLKHTASGFCRSRRMIDLDLRMYIGARDPMDEIEIRGDPDLRLVIPGGVAGDSATVASLINAIPRVLEAEPGLKTILDLPIPRAFRAN